VIEKDILIEELVNGIPESVSYLMKKGIKCIACGEPIWGTLEEAAREKGFSEEEINEFVLELNRMEKDEKTSIK
jgi:methionine synthase II (cobalamin-independent)